MLESGLIGNTMVRNNTLVTHTQGTAEGERKSVKMPGKYLSSVINHAMVLPVDPPAESFNITENHLASEG